MWEYKLSNNGGKNVNTVEGKSKGEQQRNGNKSTAAVEPDVQNNPKEKKGHVSDSFNCKVLFLLILFSFNDLRIKHFKL